MSCVRACARSGCLVRSRAEIGCEPFPFSLFVSPAFPFSLEENEKESEREAGRDRERERRKQMINHGEFKMK